MAKYKIKHTSIMHNGTLYSEGSIIELAEDQAKRLEDFLTLIPETTKPPKTPATNRQGTKQKTETPVKEEKSEGGNDDK